MPTSSSSSRRKYRPATKSVATGMSYGEEASLVLSILYGLLVVVLAIVLKVSENINTPHNKVVISSKASKNYLCFLFFIAIVCLIGSKIYASCWRKRHGNCNLIRSPHASNRWLKAIVAIFGFSVIVKESLEIIGVVEINNPDCSSKFLYFVTPLFHALFVVGQVVFLFFYAKVHIQQFTYASRFGIMHAMATNLAVWICIIADETNHALDYEADLHNHSKPITPVLSYLDEHKAQAFYDMVEQYCNNTLDFYPFLTGHTEEVTNKAPTTVKGKAVPEVGLFKGKCFCRTNVCNLIARADQFLSPMLIEFCLVASCLLYVTWSNVGKEMKHQHVVTKPSYKFYKSYKGLMLGTGVLLGTVIVMTLLASLQSGVPAYQKRYFTEYKYLVIYDTFLTFCNSVILIACVAGFYVSTRLHSERRTDNHVGLDVVLLFICLVGPLLMGLFSILSLTAGLPESKKPGWGLSLTFAVTDIVVSVVQILFIVYGSSRQPATKSLSPVPKVIPLFRNLRDDVNDQGNPSELGKDEVFSLQDGDCNKERMLHLDQLKGNCYAETSLSIMEKYRRGQPPVMMSKSEWDEESKALVDHTSTTGNNLVVPQCSQGPRNSRIKDMLKPVPPRRARLILRDIIMFLVISNSCLWMLLSLNGTAFKVYTYQSEYFGHSAWTTLSSVTKPLSIFLKLHSAACFFEIWSYT